MKVILHRGGRRLRKVVWLLRRGQLYWNRVVTRWTKCCRRIIRSTYWQYTAHVVYSWWWIKQFKAWHVLHFNIAAYFCNIGTMKVSLGTGVALHTNWNKGVWCMRHQPYGLCRPCYIKTSYRILLMIFNISDQSSHRKGRYLPLIFHDLCKSN